MSNSGFERFWNAEQYWNSIKLEENYYKDSEYEDFKAFLTGQCLVFPVHFMTFHNLFQLHYVFREHKIAINYHLDKYTRPFDKKASAM